MKIVPDNAQHIGARKEQQDAFGFSDLGQSTLTSRIGALSVVADGMGGMEQGQEMSRLACRTMIEAYTQHSNGEPIPRALTRALHTANHTVLQRARQLGVLGETGTTLSAAVIHNGGLHWASVGDSRIYLYRDGMLTQLTVDHGYDRHLDRKVAAGEISPQTAAEHPERHAITSLLGLDTLEEIDRTVKPFPLEPGDRILLCTDGLYGALSDEEIGEILRTHPAGAAQALVDAALAKRRKNQDNVTVTLFDYRPNGSSEQSAGRIRSVPVTVFRGNGRSIRTAHVLSLALLLIVLGAAGIVLRPGTPDGGGLLEKARDRVTTFLDGLPLPWKKTPAEATPAGDEPSPPDETGAATQQGPAATDTPTGTQPQPQPTLPPQPADALGATSPDTPAATPSPPVPSAEETPGPPAHSTSPPAPAAPPRPADTPPATEPPAPTQPEGSFLGRLWDRLWGVRRTREHAEPREARHAAHFELAVETDSDAALSSVLP